MAEDYEETPVYSGDTRPALMRWVGLPLTVAAPIVLAVPIIMNVLSGWRARFYAFGLIAIVAVFLSVMLRHDHNALRVLGRWFATKFLSFDARKWNGATPDPFPYRAGKAPHGIFD